MTLKTFRQDESRPATEREEERFGKAIGKPYSQQLGRKPGKGAGYLTTEHEEALKDLANVNKLTAEEQKRIYEETQDLLGSAEAKAGEKYKRSKDKGYCPWCGDDVTNEKETEDGIICPKCGSDFWQSEVLTDKDIHEEKKPINDYTWEYY